MPSSSKPTLVFVPGAFHTPSHFAPLIELLQRSSYPSLAVSLPSIGAQAATGTLADDTQAIRSVLESLIEEEGKDVIIAAHSYGGVPACQSVSGLEKSKRADKREKGGIIHVLFIAALLVEEGKALVDALGGSLPPWAEAEGNVLRPVNISAIFYSDLSAEEADHWTSLLLPQSAIPSTMAVANTCYGLDVPTTYIVCTEDPAANMVEGIILPKVKTEKWRVEHMGGGHCPFLSRKEELIQIIEACVA